MKKNKFITVWAFSLLFLAAAGGLTYCTMDQADRPLPVASMEEDAVQDPSFTDECVWNGVVLDYSNLGCGFVIRIEDEYQTILVPVSLPDPEFRLFEGQMVAVGYNIHGNQNSICQSGLLAEVFCIRQTGVDKGIFNDKAPSDDDLAKE